MSKASPHLNSSACQLPLSFTCLCLPPSLIPHRFFEDYKKNEHKEVIVDDILGAEVAKKCIKDALVSNLPAV